MGGEGKRGGEQEDVSPSRVQTGMSDRISRALAPLV